MSSVIYVCINIYICVHADFHIYTYIPLYVYWYICLSLYLFIIVLHYHTSMWPTVHVFYRWDSEKLRIFFKVSQIIKVTAKMCTQALWPQASAHSVVVPHCTTEVPGKVGMWEVRGKGIRWYWWEWTSHFYDWPKGAKDGEAKKGREVLTWKTEEGDQGSVIFLEDLENVRRGRDIQADSGLSSSSYQYSTEKVWLSNSLWASALSLVFLWWWLFSYA